MTITPRDIHDFLGRNTIGIDNVFGDLLAGIAQPAPSSFPPYDLELTAENEYLLTMAVAGYTKSEITVRVEDSSLIIEGQKAEGPEPETQNFIHRGIAKRNFERRFKLMEYVIIVDAQLADGLLKVNLKRELPEALKPRTIDIK